MVLDASAIISLLLPASHGERLLRQVASASDVVVGAPTLVETLMVLSWRLHRDVRPLVEGFLRRAEVEVIPFTHEHYEVAVSAFLRYGKGRHPAALNFGDCLSYAVARLSGLPLLYVGDYFSKTDLAATKH